MPAMNVVVLNADYTFLNFIDWRKALTLMFQEKVEALKYSDRKVKTVSKSFRIPAVIKLIELARVVYKRKVNFSKTNVFIRDNYKCAYCGRDMSLNKRRATVDHVVPKARGGKDSWKNCVTSCNKCNNMKGDQSVEKFSMRLRFEPYQPTVTQFIYAKLRAMGSMKFMEDMLKNL